MTLSYTNRFLLSLLISALMFFTLSCSKEIFVESSSDGISKDFQTLDITSNPEGADVYFNGRKTGYTTPCKIKWIENKDLNISLKLLPYSDYDLALPANQISANPVYYDFFSDDRNFGTVICNTDPAGAAVIMNGKRMAEKTPCTFTSLRPGNIKFRFEFPEHRSDSITVDVPMKKTGNDIVTINRSLIDTSLFVDYTRELPFSSVNYVYCDNSLSLQICTPLSGYFEWAYTEKFLKKMYSYHIPSQNVFSLIYDSYRNLWISSSDGLLRVGTDGNTKKYNTQNSILCSNIITSMCEDKNKNIWFCTDRGVYKYKLGAASEMDAWEGINLPYTPSNSVYVSAVGCSIDGTVWFVVPNKYEVVSFASNTWRRYSLADPSGYYFTKACPDKSNNMYFVSVNGVALFSNGTVSWLPVSELGKITCVFIDSDENVYIAGSQAIKIIKKGGSSEIISSSVNGLNYNLQILSIAKDYYKNLWLGTGNYGLVKFKYFQK